MSKYTIKLTKLLKLQKERVQSDDVYGQIVKITSCESEILNCENASNAKLLKMLTLSKLRSKRLRKKFGQSAKLQ